MPRHFILAFGMWALLLGGVAAAAVVTEVKFPPGSSATVIQQSVIRGESDQYVLAARAGQTMEVSITAVEKNAVFAIYQPGYRVTSAGGVPEVQGTALPGAGEGQDATSWKGVLPASGKYLILVGPTRGNATYQLRIAIR